LVGCQGALPPRTPEASFNEGAGEKMAFVLLIGALTETKKYLIFDLVLFLEKHKSLPESI